MKVDGRTLRHDTLETIRRMALRRVREGELGTFFDRDATLCGQPAPPGTTIYVVADLAGITSAGIGGAEFRVRSSVAGAFLFDESPEPGWIKIGTVFGDGATMAASCGVTAGRNRVVLLRAQAWPIADATDVHLFVDRHRNPSNPSYTEPMFILCDAPTYSAIPAGRGYAALLNPRDGQNTTCLTPPVAVQGRTWSQVKGLYRK